MPTLPATVHIIRLEVGPRWTERLSMALLWTPGLGRNHYCKIVSLPTDQIRVTRLIKIS